MRTQAELSDTLHRIKTVDRHRHNDVHAADLRALCREVGEHPLFAFAVHNQAAISEQTHSLGFKGAPSPNVVASLLAHYETALDARSDFRDAYEALHVAVNLHMHAASNYKTWYARMEAAGLL